MRRLVIIAGVILVGLTIVSVAACRKEATTERAAVQVGAQGWNGFVDGFFDAYYKANPQFAADQGLHEYDGLFPDWSEQGIQNWIGRLHQFRDRAAAFRNDELDAQQRFDRDNLLTRIDGDLFWLEDAKAPERNPGYYSFSPSMYLTREYAPLKQRLQAYTKFAGNMPQAVDQMLANLHTPLPRTYVALGQLITGGLADFMRSDVPQVFTSVDDPELQSAFRDANEAGAAAMEKARDWFKQQVANADDSFRLGPERFQKMLWATERVDTRVAELKEIGERDLERNLKALTEACGVFAPDATLADCVARADADKPEGDPVSAARGQLAMLRQFVVDHHVVTIPGKEEALVDLAPPYNRWNFAYIEIPGPYEKNLPSVYYIAPPDPSWSKADQEAYLPGKASLLFTSVHEVWPGHFLQFLHANRVKSKIGRSFIGYGFAEGWAHYAEEMMWEEGLGNGDPETHIGQLKEALLRNVRFLSAIGLHTGDMTVAESEKMFRDKAFQDPGNARQQAARGTFDPAYLNYTLGKLMIRKLRDDWTADHGGRGAWQQFHDQFLSYGGPPIPLVRRQMMGDKGSVL
jgi:uncharacterized protein (DUF885 family)